VRGPGSTDRGIPTVGADEAPAIRDACPSVHEPFAQLDGALVRIRVPGGVLSARALRAISAAASAYGTALEITSRANLQIRGVSPGSHAPLVRALVEAGVALGDAAADARRNVLASPTAGVDPGELTDTRSLIAVIVDALIGAPGGGLSPKFGVLVDGGGVVNLRGRRQDICLGAVRLNTGSWGYEVRLAQSLPELPGTQPIWVVRPQEAGNLVLGAVDLMVQQGGPGGRMSGLVALRGADEVLGLVAERRQLDLTEVRPDDLGPTAAPSLRPIGVMPQRHPDHVMVGGMPVLGRLSAGQLEEIADAAERFCARDDGAEVRLTPWRSVVIPDVPLEAATSALRDLEELGLAVDATDPALNVVACAGRTGCPSSFTDAQRDARATVDALRATKPASRFTVHLSGCSKRCADSATDFDVTLVGGPSQNSYQMVLRSESSTSERVAQDGLDVEAALASVLSVAGSLTP
jgi:precorrin-3B synthase